MGELGKELLKRLGIAIAGGLVIHGIVRTVDNLSNGKTVTGKEKAKKLNDETYVDWKGNVVLGASDGWVS